MSSPPYAKLRIVAARPGIHPCRVAEWPLAPSACQSDLAPISSTATGGLDARRHGNIPRVRRFFVLPAAALLAGMMIGRWIRQRWNMREAAHDGRRSIQTEAASRFGSTQASGIEDHRLDSRWAGLVRPGLLCDALRAAPHARAAGTLPIALRRAGICRHGHDHVGGARGGYILCGGRCPCPRQAVASPRWRARAAEVGAMGPRRSRRGLRGVVGSPRTRLAARLRSSEHKALIHDA